MARRHESRRLAAEARRAEGGRHREREADFETTTFEEFVDLAKRATFVPVVKELVADLLTPVSAFLKVAEHSDYAFLLEASRAASTSAAIRSSARIRS